MDLSIVMVNYNTKEHTAQSVRSIFECVPQILYEIIIVDNSSDIAQKYYCTEYQNVTVLHDVANKGFGNACNIGTRYATGKYVLYLNSDTIMHKGILEACVQYLQQYPQTGALGTRTLLENGTLDHGCKRGFPTPMSALYYFLGLDRKHPESKKYGAYRQTFIAEDSVNEVDSVSGCFLMMQRDLFDKFNGFDETFFMYGEDLDLCFRIKESGYQVVYYGKASITHMKGQSGLHTKSKTVIYHFYNAMLLFYKKHYRNKYNFLTTILVYCGIKSQYALAIIRMKLGKS